PLNGYCQTLKASIQTVEGALQPSKRVHPSPQTDTAKPSKASIETVEDALHTLKECTLPFSGFTQLSSHLIFMNPHFYESLVKSTKEKFASNYCITHLMGFHLPTELSNFFTPS
ncbi:hypothetical protein, partial [Bartonella sp. AU18XJBT]|uniref:hypothetical protein n=1 Tax=Bartonella sp. AU18XJBT TaxID=3019089 RepID=UPI00235EC26B